MKYCDKCKVDVRGKQELCPLCQGPLKGAAEEPVFPDLAPEKKKLQLFFKLTTFGCLAAAVLCVMVNQMAEGRYSWSILAVFGILCFWLVLRLAINKRHKIIKNIAFEALLVSGLSLIWDRITGWRGWSLEFVIPAACLAAIIAFFVIGLVKKLPYGDYIFYILAGSILGLLPYAFYLLHWVEIVFPSLVCSAACLIILAFLLLFCRKTIWLEINKRFHI